MTPQYRIITTHAALSRGAGWLDVSARGRLTFVGPDAATFLHNLVTNDVLAQPSGSGCYAAWLTPQGRMISDLRLLRTDASVLAEVPEGLAQKLATAFDQLIFAEQVTVTDVSASTRALVVAGDRAVEAIARSTGLDAGDVRALPTLGHLESGSLRVVRTDDVALSNFLVWLPADDVESFLERLRAAGAEEMSADLYEALRIEAGHPKFGIDMTTETIPLEAGLLDRAISTTKGCYVGQEVVIRILHRGGGRVAKRLVQVTADVAVEQVPAPGTPVVAREVADLDAEDHGRGGGAELEVGVVTSAALGPATGRVVGLALVRRDAAEVGRRLRAGDIDMTISGVTS